MPFVCLYEFIGTAILIGALNLSGGKAEAVTIALFCIAIFLGPVSGGHVNPAVSTAVFIKEGKMGNLAAFLFIIAS
jgi:glycerol uptake facilitator-like aquaporin